VKSEQKIVNIFASANCTGLVDIAFDAILFSNTADEGDAIFNL